MIKRKLVEWYKLAPKSDRHDPSPSRRGVAKQSMRMGERGGPGGEVHSVPDIV